MSMIIPAKKGIIYLLGILLLLVCNGTFLNYFLQFKNNITDTNYYKSLSSQKHKKQYDNQTIVTNTTAELTHPTESGWKDDLETIIKDNIVKLTTTVDKKNQILNESIENTVNKTLKEFQSVIVAPINTMITSQIEAINKKKQKRITYTLNKNGVFEDLFDPYYACINRTIFPPVLKSPRVFDFNTTISLNNLKIIVMGDSVAMQMAACLDEALGTSTNVSITTRKTLKYEWGLHEAIVLNNLGNGNALAAYRLLGMLGNYGKERWRPNKSGGNGYGGWQSKDVINLLNHSASVKKFDAMIFVIPHGWMSLGQITKEKLIETTTRAHELFNVDTIIFTTIPFSNNIITVLDFQQMMETNEMIQRFCQEWNREKADQTGVKNLMTLEIGNLVQGLMEDNASALGYNISNSTYWMDRLQGGRFPPSVAHICAERIESPSRECTRNAYSLDGMHLCMNTIGSRFSAAVACLLGCSYNGNLITNVEINTTNIGLNHCSSTCNQQYMSLHPITESMYSD